MKWKTEKKRGKAKGATVRFGKFKLSVHRYINCGDIWFASCYGLFEMAEMESKNLEEAKLQAVIRVQADLKDALTAIDLD